MAEPGERRAYRGADITVTYDRSLCEHAAECVKGLPEVFHPQQRPWITPDDAGADRVAEVVRRCPSGALQYDELRQPKLPQDGLRENGGQRADR